jgi:iron complex outermembrane recepter protein
LTYSETDFVDRIVSTGAQNILATDYFNYQQANNVAASPKPTAAQLAAWVADPRSDKRVLRDPLSPDQILRVFNSSSNASSMLVKAYDMNYNYRFELPEVVGGGKLGSFTFNVAATYLDEYSYQLSPEKPVVQAVGHRNWGVGAVPPMPRIKGDIRIGWVRGQHSASLVSHYIHSLRYNGYQGSQVLTRLNPLVVPRNVTELRASHVEDLAYNYRGVEALGGEFNFTVGSRNVFDRRPQRMAELGGTEDLLYDAMGRMIYARISYEM